MGGLHRACLHSVRTLSPRRQSKYGTPAIARVIDAQHHLLLHQALQDAGQCTGVQVKDRGELSRRKPRRQADHAQHEALWSGDANRIRHPFGRGLEPGTTAHSSCMNCSTSGRLAGATASEGVTWERATYFELKVLR
jgi:hypothetical protein